MAITWPVCYCPLPSLMAAITTQYSSQMPGLLEPAHPAATINRSQILAQVAEIYLSTPRSQTKLADVRIEGASSDLTQNRWPQSVLPLLQKSIWITSREMLPLPYASSPPSKCWPTPPPLDSWSSRRCQKANAN